MLGDVRWLGSFRVFFFFFLQGGMVIAGVSFPLLRLFWFLSFSFWVGKGGSDQSSSWITQRRSRDSILSSSHPPLFPIPSPESQISTQKPPAPSLFHSTVQLIQRVEYQHRQSRAMILGSGMGEDRGTIVLQICCSCIVFWWDR